MLQTALRHYLAHLNHDLPAGIVVFLVALPLCLGIALASGAPLLAGIVSGFIGGVVVAWASGSQLSVSGPAAGLTMIVLASIDKLGGYPAFLYSVVIAGLVQLILGILGAGRISAYFPAAVVKGMMAAVGLVLILKQIPHAVGYDADYEGDEAFAQRDTHTTFSELLYSLDAVSPGAVIVSVVAILIMLLWNSAALKRLPVLSIIPGPLVAVFWGIGFNLYSRLHMPDLAIAPEHLVNLPEIAGFTAFLAQLTLPDFSQWQNPEAYTVAATLALVASLEALLGLEAIDKLDPLKRLAPTNRELKAQGLGNILCGLLGGLPLTAVIIRGSANAAAGGQTKSASFIHGLLLLVSVLFLAPYLNLIPLASLAAILMLTGYTLAKPGLFREMYHKGASQFVPFMITIMAILLTDFLKGIAIGMASGVFYVIRTNYHAAITLTQDGNHYLLRLHRDVSFLNKPLLRDCLSRVEENGYLIIDGGKVRFIDQDILETLDDFLAASTDTGTTVEFKNLNGLSGIVQPGTLKRAV